MDKFSKVLFYVNCVLIPFMIVTSFMKSEWYAGGLWGIAFAWFIVAKMWENKYHDLKHEIKHGLDRGFK